MSLSDSNNNRQNHKAFQLPTLHGQENYVRWKLQLQNYMFRTLKNNNMDLLTRTKTLDSTYFAKDKDFSADFKEAAKKAKEEKNTEDVFDYDKALADRCFSSALANGEGFKPWVYDLWYQITNCLSDKISLKVKGVKTGDIIKLLDSIKLALLQFERYDPTDIDIKYSAVTMEVEGENDLMTFTAFLSSCIQRLEALGAGPDAKKKQRVLLNGLHQGIFERANPLETTMLFRLTWRGLRPSNTTSR